MVETFKCSFELDFGKEVNKKIYEELKNKKEYGVSFKQKLFFSVSQPSLAKLRAITNSLLRDLTIITRINYIIDEE